MSIRGIFCSPESESRCADLGTREELERYSNELFDMMIHDKFDVRIHEIYPLEEVRRATEDIEGRKTTGKLLLRP